MSTPRRGYWLLYPSDDATEAPLDFIEIRQGLFDPPATAAGTSISYLGSDIGVFGGSGQFRIMADGSYTVRAFFAAAFNTPAQTDTDGSYSFPVTTSGLTINFTGTFAPLQGGEGETIVTLESDEQPFAIGTAPSNGETPFLALSGTIPITIQVVSESTVIATANVNLNGGIGGRTITMPVGTSESRLVDLSATRPTWTFQV